MPSCLKCGAELAVNEEGIAPVLCDRCAGRATSRARRGMSTGTLRGYPATTVLVGINFLVFAAMILTGGGLMGFTGQQLVRWGGNFGPLTIGGEYWRLVTAGFVHANPLHIGFNMWCLWSLGQLSERLFGRWQTLCIYLLTGVGGALLSVGWNQGRLEVGASGAIFGIAGALLAGIKFGNLAISAGEKRSIVSSMIFFIILNFSLGLGGNIDNMCHLGGFLTGLLVGLPMGAFAQRHKLYQLATMVATAALLAFAGKELVQAHPEMVQARRDAGLGTRINAALQRGDYAAAVPLLETYTANNPRDRDGFFFLGAAYQETQQRDKAITAYQQALRIDPNFAEAKQALEELRGSDSPKK